MRASNIMGYI